MSDAALRDLVIGALLYFLFPLWLVAGIADYVCHRRTAIERTSGVGESSLHVLQAIEVGIPLVLGLFFEINALVLSIMIVAVIAHTLTALWDATYTDNKRYISPLEQHIHSHLEYIPIVAVLMVVLMHWGAFQQPDFALVPQRDPIPMHVRIAVLAPILLLQGGLLLEEFLRTWRQAARPGATRSA